MDAVQTILIILIFFWSVLLNLLIRMRRARRRQPPPPNPLDWPLPPEEPEIPRLAIRVDNLTLISKEPTREGSKIKLGTKIEPGTECLWPVARLTVNNAELKDRILPVTFRIANLNGQIVYESSLSYTLKRGVNMIYPANQFFIGQIPDAREGTTWEIQLVIAQKTVKSAQFRITASMLKKLKGMNLSRADGELSPSARSAANNMDPPPLEDLIDKE